MAAKPDAVLLGGSATKTRCRSRSPARLKVRFTARRPLSTRLHSRRRQGRSKARRCRWAGDRGEQLPDTHFSKKISMDFRAAYQKVNGMPTTDGFLAYSFDAWLVFPRRGEAGDGDHQARDAGVPQPRSGTRSSPPRTWWARTRSAISPGDSYGVDDRSLVLVRLVNGQWEVRFCRAVAWRPSRLLSYLPPAPLGRCPYTGRKRSRPMRIHDASVAA